MWMVIDEVGGSGLIVTIDIGGGSNLYCDIDGGGGSLLTAIVNLYKTVVGW